MNGIVSKGNNDVEISGWLDFGTLGCNIKWALSLEIDVDERGVFLLVFAMYELKFVYQRTMSFQASSVINVISPTS